MATDWISQGVVSSATPNARTRTAYLGRLRADVDGIVDRYLVAHPAAEDVTLEVLERIGRARLLAVGADRSLARLKQDLGLLTAQVLVDKFTPACVSTLRDTETHAPAGRRNSRPSLPWVAKYAPHRVDRVSSGERIVFDTTCVRDFVENDANGKVVEAICRAAEKHPISIADHAVPELARALVRGSIKFRTWNARAALLDQFLDARFPVAPGGYERAAASGLIDTKVVEETGASYHRAVWRHFRDARSVADLERPTHFEGADKQRFEIKLGTEHLESVMASERQRWERFIGRLAEACRSRVGKLDEQQISAVIRANLGADLADDQLARLDLPIRVIARRTIQAARGYKGKSLNDALDIDVLFYVGLPAIVCTRDERLVRLVQGTGSPDARRVVTPSTLLATLSQ